MYARTVKLIGSRKEFTEDKLEKLEAIVMDSTKVEAIYEAAKVSMGKRHIGSRGYGFLPVAPLSSKMCVCVCVWGGVGGGDIWILGIFFLEGVLLCEIFLVTGHVTRKSRELFLVT